MACKTALFDDSWIDNSCGASDMPYSYACKDCEGMESCPGEVNAGTEEEVWKLMELHAVVAHGEDPNSWDDETRAYLKTLVKDQEEPTGKTFMEMANEAMAKARAISAEEAVKELEQDPEALLVDVRDESEVRATGMGIGAVNAPGRSLAWKADLEFDEQYREPELQDRARRIITTCGSSPCYRGAEAANLLRTMGFTDVSYVEGGMKALLAAGLATG